MITISKKYLILAILVALLVVVIRNHIPTEYHFPSEHYIQNFPATRQPNGITCGPTSAEMVLRYYNKEVSLEILKTEMKTHWYGKPGEEVGMTAPDMVAKTLTEHGIYSKIRNDNIQELKYEISQNRPVIVLVRSGKKTWHYMVVIGYKGYKEDMMTFSDPARGVHISTPLAHFLLAWNHDGNYYGEDYRHKTIFGLKSSDYMKLLIYMTEIKPRTYIVTSEP